MNPEKIEFRAAAFYRMIHSVWTMTEKNRDAFPVKLNAGMNGDKVNETLAEIILEMNSRGRARACFPTMDKEVMSKVVLLVVRAFELEPNLHSKFETLYLLSYTALTITSMADNAMNQRAKEVFDLSKSFYDLGQKISGLDVIPHAEIRMEGGNQYLTFYIGV